MNQERGFFVSGGTLPPDTASYVERVADKVLFESLVAGRFCYVLNSRQLGKSSLSVHTIGRLRSVGVRTVFLDMTRFGGKNLTAEQWYMGLAVELARELGYRREFVSYWKDNADITPVQRLFGAIRDVVLAGNDKRPLVIFIDEIDATRSLPFDPDEFYAAIRECFNRRVSDPSFENLTFCLLGVAVPSDLIRNPAITPFNIGERIALEDFTLQELSAFAHELGPKGPELIERVHYWTGGHPFLSQSLCRSIVAKGTVDGISDVDEIVKRELFDYKARVSNINLADVSNIALHYDVGEADAIRFREDLLSDYERALLGKHVIDDESNRIVVVLKLSGIVRTDGRRLFVRNRIYKHVFDREWINKHMPEQELRRQRQSFRRGAVRTALVASGLVAALSSFAAFAWLARLKALSAESKLAYELYVADMNSLRLFYDNGDTGRIDAILKRNEHSPYRGFEWGYWFGRFHDSKEEYTLGYEAPGKHVEGHISTDGKEICIRDFLTSTATIVDRFSSLRVKTVRVGKADRVLPLKNAWVTIRVVDNVAEVVELKRGVILSRLGDPGHVVCFAMPCEHSNFILTGEGLPSEGDRTNAPTRFLNFWDATTGKKVLSRPGGNGLMEGFSADGRFLLTTNFDWKPSVPHPPLPREPILEDLAARSTIDRFQIPARPFRLISSVDNRRLLYTDGVKFYLRDFRDHSTVEWRPPIDGSWLASHAIMEKDNLIVLLNGGRCLTTRIASNEFLSMRENIFSIQPGNRDGQYLGCSNTVRLYDENSPSNAATVAHGTRVTRFGPHELNIFRSGNAAIQRLSEDDFNPLGSLPDLGNSDGYMYSGHWFLTKGESKKFDVLSSANPAQPKIKLPFTPTEWSCGLRPDSIVCWSGPGPETLIAYSGSEGKIRWSRPRTKAVEGLWVSPNGKRAFICFGHTDIEVIDMADGRILGPMNSHNAGSIYLTFSADGSRVFTCGGDGRTVMWDTMTRQKLMEFRGNEQQGMTSADISPDGRRVLTTTQAGAWQLWDASNGKQLLDVQVSPRWLSSAIFCSDGRRIITAGDDGNVRVWTTVEKDPTVYVPIAPSFLKGLYP